MNSSKGRPSGLDFITSWETFFPLVEILQPQVCLFIGLEASNSFDLGISKTEWKSSGLKKILRLVVATQEL